MRGGKGNGSGKGRGKGKGKGQGYQGKGKGKGGGGGEGGPLIKHSFIQDPWTALAVADAAPGLHVQVTVNPPQRATAAPPTQKAGGQERRDQAVVSNSHQSAPAPAPVEDDDDDDQEETLDFEAPVPSWVVDEQGSEAKNNEPSIPQSTMLKQGLSPGVQTAHATAALNLPPPKEDASKPAPDKKRGALLFNLPPPKHNKVGT